MDNGFIMDDCTLYIGDIRPEVTTEMLNELFSEFSPPQYCKVVVDSVTKESRCYGFVGYDTPEKARGALEKFNYRILLGKPMRIMLRRDDPTDRESGRANLFVKNIPKSFTEAILYAEFRTIGPVLSVKISRNNQGKSKGYGYVQFENEEDAVRCIATLNGQLLANQVIFIEPYKLKKDRLKPPSDFTNVFVKNIRPDMDDERLKGTFSEFGEITSARIMRDAGGKSRGFGFVAFKEHTSAQAAITAMNGRVIEGLTLHVSEALTMSERQMPTGLQMRVGVSSSPTVQKVLVENLDKTMTEAEFRQALTDCQNMISCIIGIDNGQSTGLALLKFASLKDAVNAVQAKNGAFIGSKRIMCALAYYYHERPSAAQRENIMPPRFI
ncbi:hypothetical protein ACTXT7_004697 [Hymenolepis weldensis]